MTTKQPPPRSPAKKAPVPSGRMLSVQIGNERPAMAAKVVKSGTDPFADLVGDEEHFGRFLMFYSEAGMGKTTLASQFEKPMFITTSGEHGAAIYKERGLIPRETTIVPLEDVYEQDSIPDGDGHPGWDKCLKTMDRFLNANHGRKTLIIDSVSGLQELCFQHCASKLYKGDMSSKAKDGYLSFYGGYIKAAEAYWDAQFLSLCLKIVRKGYNVILLAHSVYRQVDNPVGPDFQQYEPQLFSRIWSFTKKKLHGVYFMGQMVNVTIDEKTKKKKTLGDRRFIGISPSTYYIAKSWVTPTGESEIDCGENAAETYKNLCAVLGM
jgi:AAA domain